MIKNYFKTAIRSLINNSFFSTINILGMAIGLASFFIIMIFLINELSYDKFHANADRIFRVATKGMIGDSPFEAASSSASIAFNLKRDFPEVVSATRLSRVGQPTLFSIDDRKFYESGLMYADSTFFEIFSFELLRGDKTKVLSEPYSLVLTETLAKKYFGNEDPINQTLKMNNQHHYRVTGVLADLPDQSHMQFNVLASFSTLYRENGSEFYDNNWGMVGYHTYVLLSDQDAMHTLAPKLKGYTKQFYDKGGPMDPFLQPLTKIHLHSNIIAELSIPGDIKNVYILSAIAVFIILIACFNFMNLSTARASRRAREVGIRKVCGAVKSRIITQFLCESLSVSLIGFFISIFLIFMVLPGLSALINQDLYHLLLNNTQLIFIFFGIAVFAGLLAGIYPAFYLSAFQPIKVIKGTMEEKPGKQQLRSYLVVLQYTISIILIISTVIVFKQLSYVKNVSLGYDSENIIVLPLRSNQLRNKIETFRAELKQLSNVKEVSASSNVPGTRVMSTGFVPEGYDDKNPLMIALNNTDHYYSQTMDVNIVMGRGFSKEFSTDTAAILINEAVMKKVGWTNPIGKKIKRFYPDGSSKMHNIVGVLENFHFMSLHSSIKPMVFMIDPPTFNYLSIRMNSGDMNKHIAVLQQKWLEIEKSFPFEYFILDNSLEKLYVQEDLLGKLFIYFSFIAIFISCLGLFGLAAFIMEQRKKDICIRKVYGANINTLISLLTKQFLQWVLIANILAFPIAYFVMDNWLENFAYQTRLSWWIFAISALTAFFIALLTVIYQTYKAASQNPIKSLRFG